MRTLAQVLTEEYSEHGVHVANVVIDGLIDSPGTRAQPMAQKRPDIVMTPRTGRAGHMSFNSHHFQASRATDNAAQGFTFRSERRVDAIF
jgi:hypothetical protein